MKKLILLLLFIVGCNETTMTADDFYADRIDTSIGDGLTEGTYSPTSIVQYAGTDCSGTGSTGICPMDETVTTEADCPSGMCMDGTSAEADCPSGMWITDICMDGTSAEADCPSGMWMSLGWMSYLDAIITQFSDFSIVFGAAGVFTNFEGDTGTYTIDGTTVTITDGDEIITGILGADGTFTTHMPDTAGCFDMDDEEVDAVDEDACDATGGDWEDASCQEIIWHLVTD